MVDQFGDIWRFDRMRYGDISPINDHALRFLWVFRKAQRSPKPIWKLMLQHMRERYGLEISRSTDIGPGLYLGHAYNFTVNPAAIIDSNCNLHKGMTIGQENRRKRKGAPVIGNYVWIGVNATLFGRISVGNDVLTALGAYVNCDVPSHSIVLGNPCRVIPRDNATGGYINRLVQI